MQPSRFVDASVDDPAPSTNATMRVTREVEAASAGLFTGADIEELRTAQTGLLQGTVVTLEDE